jgi:hypothetical protein
MNTFRKACAFLLGRAEVNPSTPATLPARDFLSILSGTDEEPGASEARRRLDGLLHDPSSGELAAFLWKGIQTIEAEVASALRRDPGLTARLDRLGAALLAHDGQERPEAPDLIEAFWGFFCPQAAGIREHWGERIGGLRERRSVRNLSLCPDPIERPAKEVLFSSNILLTVPPAGVLPSRLGLSSRLCQGLEQAMAEDQLYWYDHPVQMGTAPEKNEILHGLRGLSDTLAFEKERGTAGPADRLEVVLSVSVTHPSLHRLAKAYIEQEVSRESGIRDLDLYVFTEEDTARLVEEFLSPAAKAFGLDGYDPSFFSGIFGVDGPYGRHYNFLKAAAALWQVVKDPSVRATFKIDLDQVFPQQQLVDETGASAFELLSTPLWGAGGTDAEGRSVSLGMIAGALVNQGDLHRGLFTPDVTLPATPWAPDRWIFASQVPQALSTEAEMMARYDGAPLDGRSRCLSRIHVTGGTIGIRLDSLRRHRPFTLSCIGRAEDQAYLMSVLGGPDKPCLRYAHVPGLIMRHDKHAFAQEAIRTAAAGKKVGDYERMLLFSHYARALPWSMEEIHASLDPFTGCFVLDIPSATALLCLALKALSLSSGKADKDGIHPEELLRLAARRLGPLLERFESDPEWMERAYEEERRAWHAYYDILDRVQDEARRQSADAIELIQRAERIIAETWVKT